MKYNSIELKKDSLLLLLRSGIRDYRFYVTLLSLLQYSLKEADRISLQNFFENSLFSTQKIFDEIAGIDNYRVDQNQQYFLPLYPLYAILNFPLVEFYNQWAVSLNNQAKTAFDMFYDLKKEAVIKPHAYWVFDIISILKDVIDDKEGYLALLLKVIFNTEIKLELVSAYICNNNALENVNIAIILTY